MEEIKSAEEAMNALGYVLQYLAKIDKQENEIKTSTAWDEDAKIKIKSTSWSVKAKEG